MNLRESIINGIIFWKRRLLAALLLRNEIRKFNKLGYTLISDGTSLIKHALNLGEQLRFEFMIHGRGGGGLVRKGLQYWITISNQQHQQRVNFKSSKWRKGISLQCVVVACFTFGFTEKKILAYTKYTISYNNSITYVIPSLKVIV